jgi:pyrimidine-specific ribonucleoside hydrolase
LYKKKIWEFAVEKKLKTHYENKNNTICTFLATQVQAQTKVWFDTDLMIGMPDKTPREVDDGITLIMALKQPQIEIVGISSITYVDYSYDVINKILKWHHKGAAIPVYKGSPRADDLGVENDGTRALYEALKKKTDNISIRSYD